jgi:hypothetical protein
MNTRMVKETVQEWIAENGEHWPGFRAAHLTGGITTMAPDDDYPSHKDVDMHLIFDDDSPMLNQPDMFMSIFQVNHQGINIEAGLKPVGLYNSAETILANPEITYHLTEGVESTLFDPDGLIEALRPEVTAQYRQRRWVQARLAHERAGLDGVLALYPMATQTWGVSGEFMILGYTSTFLSAALSVAAVAPPRMGGKIFVRLRKQLEALGRLELYDELISVLNLQDLQPEYVWKILGESTEAFTLAVRVRQRPHPFQHKLHRHLLPYYVETSREMLLDGYHREAFGWAATFYSASVDVILADGPEDVKPRFAARQAALLRPFGSVSDEARAHRLKRATRLYDRIFALAEEIIATNPAIVD